jgi:hypothetical protein
MKAKRSHPLYFVHSFRLLLTMARATAGGGGGLAIARYVKKEGGKTGPWDKFASDKIQRYRKV